MSVECLEKSCYIPGNETTNQMKLTRHDASGAEKSQTIPDSR